LDLGETPWCNDFITKEQIGHEHKYPLRLFYCHFCGLAQLDYTVPKEIMFSNHTYVSGTTKTLAKHFYDLAEDNVRSFYLKPKDLIVDIGGNDGTQLLQYRKLGMENLINVESASNIAEISKGNGIGTINSFYNETVAEKNFKPESVKLINAAGVFFHLEELHSVLRGIKYMLSHDGIFVVQFMYLADIIKTSSFDAIYHEHLCYYGIRSLANLLKPYKLRIFDAFHSPIHGGSMMVRITHEDAMTGDTDRYLQARKEEKCGYLELVEFAKKVYSHKDDLREVLDQLRRAGATIYGYGAPAKGTTLLNYLGINKYLVEKLVEVNDLKVGLYTPGTHIPIVREHSTDVPDYYLLLAWNFREEILERNRGSKATFITPFPEIILHRTQK
jgi:hypothetical protein